MVIEGKAATNLQVALCPSALDPMQRLNLRAERSLGSMQPTSSFLNWSTFREKHILEDETAPA